MASLSLAHRPALTMPLLSGHLQPHRHAALSPAGETSREITQIEPNIVSSAAATALSDDDATKEAELNCSTEKSCINNSIQTHVYVCMHTILKHIHTYTFLFNSSSGVISEIEMCTYIHRYLYNSNIYQQ